MKKEFKLDEVQLHNLFDISGSAFLLADLEGKIQYINKRFTEITGYQAKDILDSTPDIFNPESTYSTQHYEMFGTIVRGDTWQGHIVNASKNNDSYWAIQSVTPIKDTEGKVSLYLAHIIDTDNVSELEVVSAEPSITDEISGLNNRHVMLKDLEKQIEHYHNAGDEFSLCLIKVFNLSNTHKLHDIAYVQCLIKSLVNRVSAWGQFDLNVYRLNIDHLVVLLPCRDDAHDLERLYNLLSQPISFIQDLISTKLHIGYVKVTPEISESAELLLRSDIALNFAIKQNRNWKRYAKEDEHHPTTSIDSELFEDLQYALIHNNLHLAAQPIFELETGKVAIVEILLRWTHKTYGEINPLKIIELAGKNGYLFNVASYIINRLIKFLKKQQDAYQEQCFSINLNLPQIINSKLINHLFNLLDNNGIDRSRIIFESTETDSMPIPISQATKHFHWIRSQGVRIALDDFGSGYSTLDYINSLDVDLVKIDRSLVTGIEHNERKLDTFLSLVQLCDRIGVKTVVEGIENEKQHQLIASKSNSNLLVQGFLYAKPSLLDLKEFCFSKFSIVPENEHYQLIS